MSNASKPTPIRVLTRPQSSPTLNSPQAKATPFRLPPPPAECPNFPDKVVVVGFIGGRSDDVSQLMNRIVDANVFGSGGVDRSFLCGEQEEELRRWLRWHRVSYYHEVERGIVYLQFVDKDLLELVDEGKEFGDVVEEWELGGLQGMLLMFSVCHLLVLVQEGSRFSTQVLKKFRVLQAAKNALSPFLRSQTASSGAGMPHSTSFSNHHDSVSSLKNPSPGRSGGMRRNASSFSGVLGLDSSTSMFPGNCTPVALFVFVDDFSNIVPSSSTLKVATDKSFVQSSNLNIPARPGLPMKGAGSVVVLARPAIKSEQSPRKKLQSSLESQIRFLVKKSKLQIGPERSRSGLRSGGVFPTSAPLLSLDASKTVILVDKVSSQPGKSLEFACSLVDEILKGKATSDTLLLENHGQMAYQDDFKSLKDFIMRQCDIFRGRGASPSAGVGMIAAAAVAAATSSASSGKSVAVPELPNFKSWLSISQLILRGLLSTRSVCLDVMETCTSHSHEKPVVSEVNDHKSIEAANSVVSLLDSGTRLNSKFSNLWCQRLLPAAKDIYLQDMPSCYPTRLHETQLQKALSAFHSMVKGPAVKMFSKKLQEECILVWKSGRQLCDAVSLTGKPCVHQKHDLCTPPASDATVRVSSHSSGFIFLHACACGRSRILRADPFDFNTANSSSLCPVECGKLPNGLQFPQTSSGGIGKTAGWSLLRIGAANYYDTSTGLLQSGFCTSQNFLFSWIILLETPNFSKVAPLTSGLTVVLNDNGTPDVEPIKDNVVKLYQRDNPERVIDQRRSHVSSKFDGKPINTVRETLISTIKKPFSEIVAGSAASDLDFPPLKLNKQVVLGTGKGLKQSESANRNIMKVHADSSLQDPHRKSDSVGQKDDVSSLINDKDNWPHLQIGNNTISANFNVLEKSQIKQVVLYVGFEYECSHGHRFMVSPEHLLELGLLNTASGESHSNSIRTVSSKFSGTENGLKSSSPSKAHQQIYETNATVHRGKRNGKLKEKNPFKLRERMSTGESQSDHIYHGAPSGNDHNYRQRGMSSHLQPAKNLVENLKSDTLDSKTSAIALLNTNLPVYINCPHCSNSKHKENSENVKFACTSQLQRIFMVTPPLPVVLATCPVVQYETSCLPPSVPNREEKLQFSPACDVILPPESFIVLRLPFIYGIQMEDGNSHPLSPFERRPELTAWLVKGTALRVVSGGCSNSG